MPGRGEDALDRQRISNVVVAEPAAVPFKAQARWPFVLLLGYTNGYVGYIPSRAAYADMDYEVLMSPFAPGSGERLANALRMLLTQE